MNTEHHRRTANQIRQDDERLIAHLDAGGSPKAFAIDNGLGIQAVYQRARALGYRATYVRSKAARFYNKTAA